jgi:hypothetical protein
MNLKGNLEMNLAARLSTSVSFFSPPLSLQLFLMYFLES